MPEKRLTLTLPFNPLRLLGLPANMKVEIVRVIGTCMLPSIRSGDLLFVRRQKPKHNDVVVASVDGKQMVKRYLIIDGKPRLRPDNAAHAEPTWKHEMKVLRVAVASFRRIFTDEELAAVRNKALRLKAKRASRRVSRLSQRLPQR
jgi:hypothetical protein